jgi:hypothetical protein
VPIIRRQRIVDLLRELIDQDLPITWQIPSADVLGAEGALR